MKADVEPKKAILTPVRLEHLSRADLGWLVPRRSWRAAGYMGDEAVLHAVARGEKELWRINAPAAGIVVMDVDPVDGLWWLYWLSGRGFIDHAQAISDKLLAEAHRRGHRGFGACTRSQPMAELMKWAGGRPTLMEFERTK